MYGRVVPTTTTLPTINDILAATAEQESRELTYEIVKCASLHTVDLSRSIKSELFTPGFVTAWNKITRRLRYAIAVSHNLAHVFIVVTLATPSTVGRAFAIALVPLGLPGCIAMLLALRYDMLYVLIRTYDFWFFWAVTVITCCSLAMFVNDVRATGSFFIAIGLLICIIVDASMSVTRVFSFTSGVAGVLGLIVIALVHLHLVPDVNELSITYNTRTISLGDIIANGILTLVILLARNAYRRKVAVQHTTVDRSSICCITYRCPVKLQLVTPQTVRLSTAQRRHNILRTSTVPRFLPGLHAVPSLRASELRLLPINEKIGGRYYIFGHNVSIRPWRFLLRIGFWASAIVSILLALYIFVWGTLLDRPLNWHFRLIVCTLTCTICSFLFAFMQPQLLRRLALSFDCAFVSFQFVVLHVCVCDTLAWDERALVMLAAHAWIHFVLATDALTPHTRKCIGFTRSFAIFVVASYGIGISLYLVKLIFDIDWNLFDRVVLDQPVFGHRLRVRVIPAIFSRLPVVICWSFRLLWRLYMSKDGELILIQGAVAYDRPTQK